MTPKLNYSILEAALVINYFPKLRGIWAIIYRQQGRQRKVEEEMGEAAS